MNRARLMVVLAISGVLAACGGESSGASGLEGTWIVSTYEREAGEVLEDIPETLPGERWTITRREGCEGRRCTFDVVTTALEGDPFPIELELRPAEGGTYVAELAFVSQCLDPATGAVLDPDASHVDSTYEVRLVEHDLASYLEIVFEWVGSPTESGLAAGCDIRSARFVAAAVLES